MTQRPTRYDVNLPKNLTYRKKYKSYYWRNPMTGKEISIGMVARKDAIAQAIEANNYIEQNYSPVLLLEKLKGSDVLTLSDWLKRYSVIYKRRKLSEKTYQGRKGHFAVIEEKLGGMILSKITTNHVAKFLEEWIVQNKAPMSAALRSILSDIFREAIVEGHLSVNPVSPTRAAKYTVKRERLQLEQYRAIRNVAKKLPEWFGLAMDLALVTAQRREDIAQMRFEQVVNNRLQIEQSKTGAMISIPLNLELKTVGLKLEEVIAQCQKGNSTEFMISAGIWKSSPTGSVHPNSITSTFGKARNLSGLTFQESPPSFHEIRSLAGRLYEQENGKEFTRKLLGHSSERMTERYLDSRGKEYVMI